jgi:anti-anti-sigma regulatory factor
LIRTLAPRRSLATVRPTYQWESPRGGALAIRLFGALGRSELRRVVDALAERVRSPRDLVCLDFEEVEHLDYRALPEFVAALARHRDRGASVWLVGLHPYLRCLFQVAGQGPIARQLEWEPASERDRAPAAETIH